MGTLETTGDCPHCPILKHRKGRSKRSHVTLPQCPQPGWGRTWISMTSTCPFLQLPSMPAQSASVDLSVFLELPRGCLCLLPQRRAADEHIMVFLCTAVCSRPSGLSSHPHLPPRTCSQLLPSTRLLAVARRQGYRGFTDGTHVTQLLRPSSRNIVRLGGS